MSDNSIEEALELIPNWPGYEYPLACRMLRQTDAFHLYPVMKKSALNLSSFIEWGKYASGWNYKQVTRFVRDHVKSEFPRFHVIFTIGYEVVGFGSLAPMPDNRSIQVALWTAKDHQSRGIGNWIVNVLEWYAFNVFGYDFCYYQFDQKNERSGKLPVKRGYTFSHSFEGDKDGAKASGVWNSYKLKRPDDLPPGAIDTGTLEKWSSVTFPWKCLI
jgi:RimJ/RimL family protein N-acetyltransferase